MIYSVDKEINIFIHKNYKTYDKYYYPIFCKCNALSNEENINKLTYILQTKS